MPQQNNSDEFVAVVTSLRRHLERRQRAGIQVLGRAEVPIVTAAVENHSRPGSIPVVEDLLANQAPLSGVNSLGELRAAIGDCRLCKLCAGRTNLVFGVGNPNAKLMFVGEGPGRDEDLQGEPFVGRAGQLLTDIITKGMGLRRDDVYIANVVKCRPPDNRNPEAEEVAACEPFLKKQIDLIGPRIIVGLGTFAVQTLLQNKVPISRLRGNWHSYHGIKLMPTFHPAYLLRSPGEKKLVWEDIKKVIKELHSENP